MQCLALDIGGANLKAADGLGYARSHPLALWKHPERLAQQLRSLVAQVPSSDHLAVTMTGELADCFSTKAEGVRFILDAVQRSADGRRTRVYLTDGSLVAPQIAMERPALAAAANWHALARFAGRYVRRGSALLMDVGSTTTDLVPLQDGRLVGEAEGDTGRLLSGQLVYTGVGRTPVCAVASQVPYRGHDCPVASELFATMSDVYTIVEDLPEDRTDNSTADGRPATRAASCARLARMICADAELFDCGDARTAAQAIADEQVASVARGLRKVLSRLGRAPEAAVLGGQGEFLARRTLEEAAVSCRVISLSSELGPDVSRCAPAHALAVLSRETPHG